MSSMLFVAKFELPFASDFFKQ